jgi:vacuolar protein sorting-associated protein VTA1
VPFSFLQHLPKMAAAKRAMPYLARANEMDAHEPIVAYYCRLHGIEMLMKVRQAGQSTPESDGIMMDALGKAEQAKKAHNLDPAECQDVVEAFAIRIFDQVDSTDRAGMTEASTANTFYIASQFLEVCAQFYSGEMPPDLAEKSKYAKYRAVQIRDCLKKGLPLAPENPMAKEASDTALTSTAEAPQGASSASSAPSAASTSGAQPFVPAAAPAPAAATSAASSGFQPYVAPAAASAPATVAAPASTVYSTGGGGGAAPAKVKEEAKKKAEFAASCLEFNDPPGAQRFLQEALELLQPYDS